MFGRRLALPAAGLALLALNAAAKADSNDAVDAAADNATSCYSGVLTLVARGTYQNAFNDTLDPIASAISAAIPGSGSAEVVYPATLQVPISNYDGVENAQQQLDSYYSQCPNGKTVLLGYSQGAQCLEIALVGTNLTSPYYSGISSNVGANVVAVVLFGDLTQVPSQGQQASGNQSCTVDGPLARTGYYLQEMASYAPRLQEWCHAEDPICCSTGNNITAHLDYFGNETTDRVVDFVKNLYASAASNSTSSGSTSTGTAAPTNHASSTSAPASTTTATSGTSTHPSTASSTTGAAVRMSGLPAALMAGAPLFLGLVAAV